MARCPVAAGLPAKASMRTAHCIKATAHLAIGVSTIALCFWKLAEHPQSLSWLVAMLLGFLALVIELPELARADAETVPTPELAAQRRAFEAHCREGGWHDSELNYTRDDRYANAVVNESWQRWLAKMPGRSVPAATPRKRSGHIKQV